MGGRRGRVLIVGGPAASGFCFGSIDCAGILKLRNSDIELRKGETDIGRKNTRVRLVFRVHIPQPSGRTLSLQVASNPIECCECRGRAGRPHRPSAGQGCLCLRWRAHSPWGQKCDPPPFQGHWGSATWKLSVTPTFPGAPCSRGVGPFLVQ